MAPNPYTRRPIPIGHEHFNSFRSKFHRNEDGELDQIDEYEQYLDQLQRFPLELLWTHAFRGLAPFDWGPRGVILGQSDPLLGEGTMAAPDPVTGFGRLPADRLQERIDKIKEYVQDIKSRGGVKRFMTYMDLGTQLYGKHNRNLDELLQNRQISPSSSWGFWEFYDHWEEYAQPTGPFELGPKPPDPSYWLRKWHNPLEKTSNDLPDELRGLSFAGYSPVRKGAPYYRYAVSLNSEGWSMWWKQVIQWIARVGFDGAFIDNATFSNCWSDESQQAYKSWINTNFAKEEIARYLTTIINNKFSYGDFSDWHTRLPGLWEPLYWVSSNTDGVKFFPDYDAVRGQYSCRLELSILEGDSAEISCTNQFLLFSSSQWGNGQELKLRFYHKSEGAVSISLIFEAIVLEGTETKTLQVNRHLPLSQNWREEITTFFVGQIPEEEDKLKWRVKFHLGGEGKIWLDEFWLGFSVETPEERQELEYSSSPSSYHRRLIAQKFWSSVASEKVSYLKEEARKINPNFEIYTNSYVPTADFFMMEWAFTGGLDRRRHAQQRDVGFFPGIIMDPILDKEVFSNNCFGYKYVHGLRNSPHFAYHIPGLLPVPGDHNRNTALLALAEAAAFGDGIGLTLQMRYRTSAYKRFPEEKKKIEEVQQQFWSFVNELPHLFEGYHPYADIGIVFREADFTHLPYPAVEDRLHAYNELYDMAKDLAGSGILWDVLAGQSISGMHFSKYKALIYQDVERISDAEIEAVQRYLECGGLVISAKIVGDEDEWHRMRLPKTIHPWPNDHHTWPPLGSARQVLESGAKGRVRPDAFTRSVGKGKLIYQPASLSAEFVLHAIEEHLGTSIRLSNLSEEALKFWRFNAWLSQDRQRLTIHLLDYQVRFGLENPQEVPMKNNITVSVPLPSGSSVDSVSIYNPPDQLAETVPFSVSDEKLHFSIPSFSIYAIVLVRLIV